MKEPINENAFVSEINSWCNENDENDLIQIACHIQARMTLMQVEDIRFEKRIFSKICKSRAELIFEAMHEK